MLAFKVFDYVKICFIALFKLFKRRVKIVGHFNHFEKIIIEGTE